ncbi:DMT family transporter [Billgrantia diversa]|uniref:EamA family transporter n=1 Tax=Halomonas sp. MCCC 1A13316 TaxID=2733487 RepID=UPI0018A66209|nr:EamA family transporter [Halomonas sp. MCCC 1A13316]QOR37976.1 DMT family transporter [Halomonas sp. MCCC 1A13316]
MASSQSLPILLSLASSLMFASTFFLIKMAGQASSSLAAIWVTLSTNVGFLWSWSLLRENGIISPSPEWQYFVLAGIFAPLLGRMFQFQGMAKLGANITTPITLTHPIFTVLLSVIFLDESLGRGALYGIFLVLGGGILLGFQGGRGTMVCTGTPYKFLLLPLAASLAYGVSVLFRKLGIDMGSDAVTAAAVTTSTSWLLFAIYLVIFRPSGVFTCKSHEFIKFVGAGVFSSLGPVFLYMALQVGKVSVVAPLASTTPFFVLLVTGLYMRNEEVLNRWVVLGTIFTVLGVVLIVSFGMS